MLNYQIETKICTLCKLCIKDCPAGAIKEITDSPNKFLEIKATSCIHCGHCAGVCPVGAVTCNGNPLPKFNDPKLKEDDIFRFIVGKRSVRNYQKKAIKKEQLNKIIEVGTLTATASNSQDVRAEIFIGKEVSQLSKSLCSELLTMIKSLNHPLGRFVLRLFGYKNYSSKRRMSAFSSILKEGTTGKKDPLFFKAPVVIHLTHPKKNTRFGRTNCVLAGENMMLYAHSLGIESCMIGFAEIPAGKRKGKKALKTGKGRQTGLVFTLGYGIPKYLRLPKRVPISSQGYF